jgi:hypothetical protein
MEMKEEEKMEHKRKQEKIIREEIKQIIYRSYIQVSPVSQFLQT